MSQKFILHFSEASLHVPWCFIPQKNSRASLITWLKGYLVIFTYDQDICTQSWGGNCGTPCSFGTDDFFVTHAPLIPRLPADSPIVARLLGGGSGDAISRERAHFKRVQLRVCAAGAISGPTFLRAIISSFSFECSPS